LKRAPGVPTHVRAGWWKRWHGGPRGPPSGGASVHSLNGSSSPRAGCPPLCRAPLGPPRPQEPTGQSLGFRGAGPPIIMGRCSGPRACMARASVASTARTGPSIGSRASPLEPCPAKQPMPASVQVSFGMALDGTLPCQSSTAGTLGTVACGRAPPNRWFAFQCAGVTTTADDPGSCLSSPIALPPVLHPEP